MKNQIFSFSKMALFILFSIHLFAHAKKLPPKKSDIVFEPSSLSLGYDQEHEIVVHGGKPPYVFKTSVGMIRYTGNVATYISPNVAGEAVVTVKDANGVTKALVIHVISEKPPASP